MKLNNRKKGFVFWITGLSGSGKTTLGKNIKDFIQKKYGPTLLINGDDVRNIFNFKKYTYKERLNLGIQYSKLCSFISKQNVNVIFTVVGLFDKVRNYNKKNIKNYIEIYIRTDFKKLKIKSNKKHYKNKIKNVWGVGIKPQLPKNPDIIIENNFDKNINILSQELKKKITTLL